MSLLSEKLSSFSTTFRLRSWNGLRTVTLVLVAAVVAASIASAQCPAVGADTNCGVVLTILNIGSGNAPCPGGPCVTVSNNQGPFDEIEDTLVGVVNQSTLPISSIVLTSGPGGADIFGFDGDGICGISPNTGLPYVPVPPGCPFGPTGYEGPGTSFSNISADYTTGTVTFTPPIAAKGGTAYFSLEDDLTAATACTTLINNALMSQASGKNVCATFTPNQGYTLAQAAQLCNFTQFDWIQHITKQYDPSEFYARNTGGAFDAAVAGNVRLTSKTVPWSDPPQGGGYAQGFGGDATPDNSYPFYYDPAVDLPSHTNGSPVTACTLPITAGSTLTMHDAPSDGCLPGGGDVGSAKCTDAVNAPGVTQEPAGSFGGYETHLAGINADGSAKDLGIGFTWTSNNSGTTGGVTIKKTDAPADGNGTGGITVTSVNQTTSYQYPIGVAITSINGISLGTAPQTPLTALTGIQVATIASGLVYSHVSQTFNGTVTIANQSGAPISGPFQVVLSSLTSGETLANATSSFGGFPFVTVPAVNSLSSGQTASLSVQFQNPSNSATNFDPIIYSGSFN